MSGILKYFQVVKKTEQSTLSNEANLPEPNRPLSKVISSPAIAAANKKVSATNNAKASATRGAYLHLTGAQKYQVGKRAAEFGLTSALRYYARHYPDLPLKETPMRHFKNQYFEDLKSKIAETVQMRMKVMMTKKQFLSCQTRRWGGHFLLVNKLTGKFRNIYASFVLLDQLLILL